MIETMNDFLHDLLILFHAPGITANVLAELLIYFPNIAAITRAKPDALKHCRLKNKTIAAITQPNRRLIEADLAWAEQPGHHIISLADSDYPIALPHVKSPPLLLYIKGNPALLHSPQIAIVGSRNPSHAGREHAQHFAHDLCQAGLTVTSGMALGIDTAAHRGALQAKGNTIAVLGSGLESIYPKRNLPLSREIAASGALISEYPLRATPLPAYFPQRNRIIAGLSQATLVVEAALKSGSLITAHLAADQGKEVFAIPSSIHNPLARGCHHLIKEGAKLVETVTDITQELTEVPKGANQALTSPLKQFDLQPYPELDRTDRYLLDCVGFEATTVDQLVIRTGNTVGAVVAGLLTLETSGLIRKTASGYIRVH